jgi:formylmethanofuran dehydrogenase subunit E
MIIGQCLNALNKNYHAEHFLCTHCNLPFPNGTFIEHEGQPYCEADYNELFSERCAACQQPITDKCVSALGNKYHPHHFNCSGCGKNLVGQPFKDEDGDIFCTACKQARKQRLGIILKRLDYLYCLLNYPI